MKYFNIIILAVLVSTSLVSGAEDGKHLFILSGQSNMAGLDPDISFTPAVTKAFGKDKVIVIKDAHGGQPISRWYKHNTKPHGKKSQTRGDLYDKLLEKVLLAIKGEKLKTVTFVWMQGESDVRETAITYGECLEGLIGQLKQDLKFKDINFVIGRISDYGLKVPGAYKRWNFKKEGWELIRKTQVEYANSYPLGAWVDTDGLNDGKDHKGRTLENGLHLATEGYKILGQRFAEKAIELIQKKPSR